MVINDATVTLLIESVQTSVLKDHPSGSFLDKEAGVERMEIMVAQTAQTLDALLINHLGAFANGLLPHGLKEKAATIMYHLNARPPMFAILKHLTLTLM